MESLYFKIQTNIIEGSVILKNHDVIFIAEKKDAAFAIANAISTNLKQHDGYLEDITKGYYYTWAQGHLLTLKEPGEMKDEWKEWNWDSLPIIPSALSLKPLPNATKQLNIISKLTKGCRVIINCCDCAVEGELVHFFIRTYLGLANILLNDYGQPLYKKLQSRLHLRT